jgi:hypothetical protein
MFPFDNYIYVTVLMTNICGVLNWLEWIADFMRQYVGDRLYVCI